MLYPFQTIQVQYTHKERQITRIICSALTGLRPSADSALSLFLLTQQERQSLRAVEPQSIFRDMSNS
jgi:hypothetical protein